MRRFGLSTPKVMTDFTVKLTLIELSSGKIHARIDQSPNGASKLPGHEFDLPSDPATPFQKFLKDWHQPTVPDQSAAEAFGKELYSLVFDSNIRITFSGVLSDARAQGKDLRLALNLNGSCLRSIPFELLHDGQGFLLYGGVRIVRIFDELSGPTSILRPFRRLLLVLAEPKDQPKWGRDKYESAIRSSIEGIGGIEVVNVKPPTKNQVLETLRNQKSTDRFDAVHIVAHGEVPSIGDSELFLEDASGKSEALAANVLAQALRGHAGCFAYLNSCSTSATRGESPFTGYAQRLMRDGQCGSVFAMQKPILANRAIQIAVAFFHDLARGHSAEVAAHWAVSTHGQDDSWAIPCLHTHLSQPEQERRDRIAAFFSADPNEAQFAFYLPVFRLGYTEAEYSHIAGQITMVKRVFNYKGKTNAQSDVAAAMGLVSLIAEILPSERAQDAIQFFSAEEITASKASHIFVFGSKSHALVEHLMHAYSKDFDFEYCDPDTKSTDTWKIKDLKTAQVYSISDPSKLDPGSDERTAAKETDYAVVEKIVDRPNNRIIFVIAGLQDRGTRGAGAYLVKNWEELVQKYGAAPFQILLKFEPELGSFGVSVVDRKTA